MTVYESWASSSLSLLLLCIDWLSIYTTIHTSSLEKEMATHSSILFFFFYFILLYNTVLVLPGKSHGWRRLAGYSPWGRRVRHD